jgi:hypothetical protein
VLSKLEGIGLGLKQRHWTRRKRLFEPKKSEIRLERRQRRRLLESRKSRVRLERR